MFQKCVSVPVKASQSFTTNIRLTLNFLKRKLPNLNLTKIRCIVCVGQIFEFIELILFLETYLRGVLGPSNQTVGSLMIPPGSQSWPQKRSEQCSNGFNKVKNLTTTLTLPNTKLIHATGYSWAGILLSGWVHSTQKWVWLWCCTSRA